MDILNIIKDTKYNIGVYAVDKNNNEIKYNENHKFEAASCIKIFIMAEYFNQLNKNITKNTKLIYNKEDNIPGVNSGIISKLNYGLELNIEDYVILMICYSDNIATNKLIDILGINNINKTIKELGFKDTKLYNKLDILKYMKFGSTTPYEYSLMFKKIYNKEIISKEHSEKMLEILKQQENNSLLTKFLPTKDVILRGTDESNIKYIASKSGTIILTDDLEKNSRNDGGIISTIYGDYIVSIFISNIDDLRYNCDNKAIEIGAKINKQIYDEFIINKGVFE